MSSKAARRLGVAVLQRRKELGLNQLEVGAAGGPSNTKLTEIESGRATKLTNLMERKLDRSLQWRSGSARRVWEGVGEPVPVEADDLIDRILSNPRIPVAEKLEMVQQLRRSQEEPPQVERGTG